MKKKGRKKNSWFNMLIRGANILFYFGVIGVICFCILVAAYKPWTTPNQFRENKNRNSIENYVPEIKRDQGQK